MNRRRWGDQARPPDPIKTEGPEDCFANHHKRKAGSGPTRRRTKNQPTRLCKAEGQPLCKGVTSPSQNGRTGP